MASDSDSRTIPIGGIRVQFPYKPYPSQLSMMAKIINGLEKQQNCLLESPTGTGKSLALLCSAAGWLEAHKIKLDKEAASKKFELAEELDPTLTCNCKCHLQPKPDNCTSVKVEMETSKPVEPSSSAKTLGEQKLNTTINLDSSSQELDDDDDFKVSGTNFRTPTAVKHRSHLTIKYEDSSTQGTSSKQTDSEISGEQTSHPESSNNASWKMEVSSRVQDMSEKLQEASVPCKEIIDCGNCNCAEVIRFHMDREKDAVRYPTIYYGTRTHRQLSQITKELARTGYRHTRMTLLAAKRHTCIHERVSVSKDVNENCRQMLDGNGCSYNDKARGVNQGMIGQCGLEAAWDLEDLMELCREISACPYFAARELRNGADIIFCPYNYLIDPNIRGSMEINLEGDIVILDEAHNVEDAARSAASYEVSDKQLTLAMTEMDQLMNLNRSLSDYAALKKMCRKVMDVIDETKLSMQQNRSDFDITSKTYSGREIVVMLQKMGCTSEDVKKLRNHLQNTISDADEHIATKKMKLPNASMAVLKGFFQVLDYIYKEEGKYLIDYRLAVTRSTTFSTQEGSGKWLNARKSNKNVSHTYTLNLWCLNPAVAFSDFSAARSVILTSGTLAPILSFQSELGLPFPIQLEANHVISSNQVWVGVVGKGPKNRPLVASYQNSETLEFQDEVGKVILDVCKKIPHGILCFVSSYKMLEKLRTRWLDTGLWQQMEKIKGVYSEPRGSDPSQFEEVVRDYYADVERSENLDNAGGQTGGLLFAVCRGKLSEGIDFSNNKARGVIVLGIPYPNVKDTLVNLKREYNNMHHQKRGLLSGGQWYEIQAFRALNQALGRCIRHRHDWGALILLDDRFDKSDKYTKGLSKWIRSRVQHFRNYSETQDSLHCFAESRKNAVDVPPTPSQQMDVSLFSPKVETPGSSTPRAGTSSSRAQEETPSVMASTPKAAVPSGSSTLARRLSDIMMMKNNTGTPRVVKQTTLTDSLMFKGHEGGSNKASEAPKAKTVPRKGIIYIDSDEEDETNEANAKKIGEPEVKKEQETTSIETESELGEVSLIAQCSEEDPMRTSPLLFDSETVSCDGEKVEEEKEDVQDKTFEYEMEICDRNDPDKTAELDDVTMEKNLDDTKPESDENANITKPEDDEDDETIEVEDKPNIRRSAKKKAPFASTNRQKKTEPKQQEKSSKRGTDSLFETGETSGLNIRRSKRRKVGNTKYSKDDYETNIDEEPGVKSKKLHDLDCPYCGEKLISGDKVKEIKDEECPELVDDLFSSNGTVYQLKRGPIPKTIKPMPPGHDSEHLNCHYSEADDCCVNLFICRNCDEGDYDRKFGLQPVGFVIKLSEDRKWNKDTVWLVV